MVNIFIINIIINIIIIIIILIIIKKIFPNSIFILKCTDYYEHFPSTFPYIYKQTLWSQVATSPYVISHFTQLLVLIHTSIMHSRNSLDTTFYDEFCS